MTTSDWIADRAAEITQALGPLGRPAEPNALLDWPNYSDVGDRTVLFEELPVWTEGSHSSYSIYSSHSSISTSS